MKTPRLNSRELIALVLDPGSFESWDVEVRDPVSISMEYAQELVDARAKTGLTESIVTGKGLIRGMQVAVVVG